MKSKSHLGSTIRSFFDRHASTDIEEKSTRRWEDALEASIAVLAVFAWLAAMTLLP